MLRDNEPGRINRFLHPSIYKEGDDAVVVTPNGGAKLYWYVLKNYFFQLVGVGLLSVLLSLPLVTIPATRTAISRVCMKLCLEGYGSVYSEFFGEWKTAILRTLPFGILSGVPAAAGLFVLYLALTGQEVGTFYLIVSGVVVLLLFLLTSYGYPLLALIDLPTPTNLKNAVFLAGSQLGANLRLLIPLVVTAIGLLLLPLSLPVLLLLFVPGPALMRAVIVKQPIETLIIRPFLEQGDSAARE